MLRIIPSIPEHRQEHRKLAVVSNKWLPGADRGHQVVGGVLLLANPPAVYFVDPPGASGPGRDSKGLPDRAERPELKNVQEQASWICRARLQRLENDFKVALKQQNTLEQLTMRCSRGVRGNPSFCTSEATTARKLHDTPRPIQLLDTYTIPSPGRR